MAQGCSVVRLAPNLLMSLVVVDSTKTLPSAPLPAMVTGKACATRGLRRRREPSCLGSDALMVSRDYHFSGRMEGSDEGGNLKDGRVCWDNNGGLPPDRIYPFGNPGSSNLCRDPERSTRRVNTRGSGFRLTSVCSPGAAKASRNDDNGERRGRITTAQPVA